VPSALKRAEQYGHEAQQALSLLPDSPPKALLLEIAEYVVERTY